MKAPQGRFLGLNVIGWLNYALLQWFFVRLAYEYLTEDLDTIGKWKIIFRPPFVGWKYKPEPYRPELDKINPESCIHHDLECTVVYRGNKCPLCEAIEEYEKAVRIRWRI